jgi:hypothetical protein
MFRFRASMLVFIIGLVLSGLTAFPLLHELRLLSEWMKAADGIVPDSLLLWIETIRDGLEHMHASYPWVAYGTDWLAFGHLVIALFFIRPLMEPLTSRSNIHAGIVACIAIVPLAMICGPIRGIPFYWQLIDCSFGIIGLIPLTYCLLLLKHIETRHSRENDLAASQAEH